MKQGNSYDFQVGQSVKLIGDKVIPEAFETILRFDGINIALLLMSFVIQVGIGKGGLDTHFVESVPKRWMVKSWDRGYCRIKEGMKYYNEATADSPVVFRYIDLSRSNHS